MKPNDLYRAVALSTGESVAEISRRGFVPLEDLAAEDGPPIDWDEVEAQRGRILFPRRKRPAIAG